MAYMLATQNYIYKVLIVKGKRTTGYSTKYHGRHTDRFGDLEGLEQYKYVSHMIIIHKGQNLIRACMPKVIVNTYIIIITPNYSYTIVYV